MATYECAVYVRWNVTYSSTLSIEAGSEAEAKAHAVVDKMAEQGQLSADGGGHVPPNATAATWEEEESQIEEISVGEVVQEEEL